MRCFLGLDLTVSEQLALDSWRQQALPKITSRLPCYHGEGKHGHGKPAGRTGKPRTGSKRINQKSR